MTDTEDFKIKYIKICKKHGYTLYLCKNAGTFEWTKDGKKFSKASYCEIDAQIAFNSGEITKELS